MTTVNVDSHVEHQLVEAWAVGEWQCRGEAAVIPLLDTLAAEWGGELAIGLYPVRVRLDVSSIWSCCCTVHYGHISCFFLVLG
jgi:hypothetical protein